MSKMVLIMENWRKYLLKEYLADRGGAFSADAIVATAASGDAKGAEEPVTTFPPSPPPEYPSSE